MDIYLDTANIEHIRHAARLGVISGVTTNPTLVSREKARDLKAAVLEICSIVPGPISVEALSLDAEGMKREARELSSWHENIVVKIPVSEAGLEAISVLSQDKPYPLFLRKPGTSGCHCGGYLCKPLCGAAR